MKERCIEGIVLQSRPFKDSGRILNVFTATKGIISFFVKHLSTRCWAMANLTSPLCRAQFIFRQGRSDLHCLIDGTIIDLHMKLRHSYMRLNLAGKMLRAITISQMPGKPSSSLYALLASYLKQLSHFCDPIILWISFQLKVLQHEGVLSLDAICLCCRKEQASCITYGESRCIKCNTEPDAQLSTQEWNVLLRFFRAKKFKELTRVKTGPKLTHIIETLYKSRYK